MVYGKKKLRYKIITIFILPPSREELFKRLLNRDLKDEKNAIKRMKQFDEDVLHWRNYDLVVVNDNFKKCYQNIINYILLSKKSNNVKKYDVDLISKHVANLLQ